jgi:serine protease AprX
MPSTPVPSVVPILPLPIRLHASIKKTGVGVGIAMVDSDFVVHPDLTEAVNRIKAYYDAVQDTESPLPPRTPRARHWHGTMTACTAAGNGHLSGGTYTSLAPNAHVILIRTMNDDHRVPTDVIVRALRYVKDNAQRLGINVVNLSVYADEIVQDISHPVNALVEELSAAGIVVVAAAGNNPRSPIRPPAAAPSAITVGGLDDRNTLGDEDNQLYNSTFGITSLGIQKPEVIAPAIFLPAPILLNTDQQREAAALCALDALQNDQLLDVAPLLLPSTSIAYSNDQLHDVPTIRAKIRARITGEMVATPFYKMVDGTSFAAPIVTSIVAQILEANPELTPGQVKDLLTSTARPLTNFPSLRQGWGVVRPAEAVEGARRSAAPRGAAAAS